MMDETTGDELTAADADRRRLQARWAAIRVANLYDTLDHLGYEAQCLDLGIRPLFNGQRLAGEVVTVRGGRDPRHPDELPATEGLGLFDVVRAAIRPGRVVVVESGGEAITGKFGEMTSWSLQQRGATGIVIDGYIRDRLGLAEIPRYTVCARGTSPIESSRRWRIEAVNEPIALPGTLTSQVRIDPGDWIVGEADGVIVVPAAVAAEALTAAEDLERREQRMREDLAQGVPFDDAFSRWGRA
jgi:regulator of RNase E activity RraA